MNLIGVYCPSDDLAKPRKGVAVHCTTRTDADNELCHWQGRPMRVLHAYNQHRGGGGADNAAQATIQASRRFGLEVQVFTRSSEDLPQNLLGRLRAGASVVYAHGAVREFTAALDSFRPDIVHIHEVFPLVSPWILPPCSRRGIPVVMTCVDYRLTCPLGTHLDGDGICTRCIHGREYWAVLKNCRRNLAESLTVGFYNTLVRTLRLFRNHVSRFITPSEFARRWLIDNAAVDPARVTTIAPLVAIQDSGSDPAAGSYDLPPFTVPT